MSALIPLQGATCAPVGYTAHNVCQKFVTWPTSVPTADQPAVDQLIGNSTGFSPSMTAKFQSAFSPACYQALMTLQCAMGYPLCSPLASNGSAAVTSSTAPVSQNLCLTSCQQAAVTCATELAEFGLSGVDCSKLPLPNGQTLGTDSASCLDTALGTNAAVGSGAGGGVAPGVVMGNGTAASSGNLTIKCFPPFIPHTANVNNETARRCNSHGCCLPCPSQAFFYADGQFETQVTLTEYASLISCLLSAYVVLSWSVLPGRRRHPGDIVLHFSIAVTLWQASGLFLIGNPRRIQCGDAVAIATASNNVLCGIQGALLIVTQHAAVMWAAYMIANLHATIVWKSQILERLKPMGVVICWGVPGVLGFIPFLVSQIDATTGFACFVRSGDANTLFFGFQGCVVVIAFVVNLITVAHIAVITWRSAAVSSSNNTSGNGRSDYEGSGGGQKLSPRRQMMNVFRMNWRSLLLGLVFVLTVGVNVIFFNVIVRPFAITTAETPWVQQWEFCAAANPNNLQLCNDQWKSEIPSFAMNVVAAI
ncbi:hypothetical protein HK101_001557, partial [Irineochytrium annulatum]